MINKPITSGQHGRQANRGPDIRVQGGVHHVPEGRRRYYRFRRPRLVLSFYVIRVIFLRVIFLRNAETLVSMFVDPNSMSNIYHFMYLRISLRIMISSQDFSEKRQKL